MSRAFRTLPALFLGLVLAAPALAAPALAADEHVVVTPDTIAWEPAKPLPAGAEWAMLHGNPREEGPFLLRIRLPAGFEMPAHWHSRDENVTLLSGRVGVGMGETLDRAKVQPLTAGSFFSMPAKMPHYVVVMEDSVVQLHGMGPFDLNFVNPADDPRKQVGSSQ